MRKPAKVLLLRSHGSKWGPGKVHYGVRDETPGNHGYVMAACTMKPIYAESFKGYPEEATCRRCRPT